MIDKNLEAALSASADYSSSFVEVVEELRAKLSQALGVDFFRDGHMNYSSAQTIQLWFNKDREPVKNYQPMSGRRDASFVINTFVSSKGKFYFISCRAKDAQPSRNWRIVPESALNQDTQAYIQSINAVLEASSYVLLPEPVLKQLADGHKTRLDNFPATVSKVLFSELGP